MNEQVKEEYEKQNIFQSNTTLIYYKSSALKILENLPQETLFFTLESN